MYLLLSKKLFPLILVREIFNSRQVLEIYKANTYTQKDKICFSFLLFKNSQQGFSASWNGVIIHIPTRYLQRIVWVNQGPITSSWRLGLWILPWQLFISCEIQIRIQAALYYRSNEKAVYSDSSDVSQHILWRLHCFSLFPLSNTFKSSFSSYNPEKVFVGSELNVQPSYTGCHPLPVLFPLFWWYHKHCSFSKPL